jgi:hypothetical protein
MIALSAPITGAPTEKRSGGAKLAIYLIGCILLYEPRYIHLWNIIFTKKGPKPMAGKQNGRKDQGIIHSANGAPLVCTPKRLPQHLWVQAAKNAIRIEPRNYGRAPRMLRIMPKLPLTPEHIAAVTDRKWPVAGVRLTVGFLDNPEKALRKRILSNMNAWNRTANVKFVETAIDPQVRISRGPGGYWSYLGTEILEIPKSDQTMNLENFTMFTPESEFHRVIRHETGHTLGFPHEHLRRELVDQLDREKTITYFENTQGWSREEVIQQVLTPLEDADLTETAHADEHSIMCYQIPGECTKDGQPIVGGADIDASDYTFAAQLYPKPHHMEPHAEEVLSALTQEMAVIDVSGGEITRITLKRPVPAELAPLGQAQELVPMNVPTGGRSLTGSRPESPGEEYLKL